MRALYQRAGVWHVRLTLTGRTVRRSLKPRAQKAARRMADALTYEVVKARVLSDLGLAPAAPSSAGGFAGCPPRRQLTAPQGDPAPLTLAVISQDLGALWRAYEQWARVHVRPNTFEIWFGDRDLPPVCTGKQTAASTN